MTYKLRRNVRLVLAVSALAMFGATAISAYQASRIGSVRLWNVLNGMVDGFLIVFLLSSYTLLVGEIWWKDRLRRLSFSALLLLNTAVYLALIVAGRAAGRCLMGQYDRMILVPVQTSADARQWLQSVAAALIASLAFNFLYQNSRLVGARVLASFVTGEYHRPKTETRVVLFLDLASSTAIAEALGDERYLGFLDRFFLDMTEAILESGAEIYKYVGDEVILSWRLAEGRPDARCLRFFFLFADVIERERENYARSFSVVPEFRAGVHVGPVVTGEIGDLKREIALVGDILNTTSRLAALAKELGRSLVVSEALWKGLSNVDGLTAENLGERLLRGKKEPLVVYGLSRTR